MSDSDKLRVGTAEREATAQVLGTAMAEGRLTLAEYEERLDALWNSSTRGELAVLTDDLPLPDTPPNTPPNALPVRSKDWREYFNEWRWWLGGVIVMTGIWGFQSISDGEAQNFWPMWPIGIWALILVASAFLPDDIDSDDDTGSDDRGGGTTGYGGGMKGYQ